MERGRRTGIPAYKAGLINRIYDPSDVVLQLDNGPCGSALFHISGRRPIFMS